MPERQKSSSGGIKIKSGLCEKPETFSGGLFRKAPDDQRDRRLEDDTLIDFYSFNGTAGQPIFITINSGAFDTFLYLLDNAGEIIDANDDSGTGTNSRIPIDGGVITLPYTGEYIIGANQFEPATGAYTLTLSTDPACAAAPIAYNQTVNGSLAGTDCAISTGGDPFFTDRYTFSGTAGQQISITVSSSSAVDSFLTLHTPSGTGSLENRVCQIKISRAFGKSRRESADQDQRFPAFDLLISSLHCPKTAAGL